MSNQPNRQSLPEKKTNDREEQGYKRIYKSCNDDRHGQNQTQAAHSSKNWRHATHSPNTGHRPQKFDECGNSRRNTSWQSNNRTQNFHKNSQRGRGAFTLGRNNSEKLTSSNAESIPGFNSAKSNPCSPDFEFNKSLDDLSELGQGLVETQSDTYPSSSNDGIANKSWDEKPKKACIKEIDDDLFSAPDDISLVHCVAADFRMGSGIAVKFRNCFQSVGKLLDQRVKPGGVAHIRNNRRHIFYLVTKELSSEKPTKRTMESSLYALYRKCQSFHITELAMPKIGCGRDGLIWDDIKEMLEQIFVDNFTITVYSIEDKSIDTPTSHKSRVENHPLLLKDVEPETGLLYIANLKSEVSAEMKSLHEKHKFLNLLDEKRNKLGNIEFTIVGCEIIYGLFCKESETSQLKYESLEKAIGYLRFRHGRMIQSFDYYAIQAFVEEGDPYVMEKIDTLFRNSQIPATFWICWPPSLERPVTQKPQDMSDVDNNCEELPMEIENTEKTRVATRQESTSNTAVVDYWNPDNSSEDNSSTAMAYNTYVENERRQSRVKKDAEQEAQQREKQMSKILKPQSCVTEYNGDLFDAEKTACLVHCVGADFRMGSGIAVLFRQYFGKVEELLQQGVGQGGVAHIKHEERYIFYLVTKMESTGKPTHDTLERSLHALHNKCKELNVTELAMPRIGCGLDRLDWKTVKSKLEEIFADDFTIRVYNLERPWERYCEMYPSRGRRSDSWDDNLYQPPHRHSLDSQQSWTSIEQRMMQTVDHNLYQPPHRYLRDSQQSWTSIQQRMMQTIENERKMHQDREAKLHARIDELETQVANLELDKKNLEKKVESLQKVVVEPKRLECLNSLGRGRGNPFRSGNFSPPCPGTTPVLIPRYAGPHIQYNYYNNPGVITNAADGTLGLPKHQLQKFSDSAILSTVRPQINPPFTVQTDKQSTVSHQRNEAMRNCLYEHTDEEQADWYGTKRLKKEPSQVRE